MEIWRFIDDNSYDAQFNMALDEAISILVRKGESKPVLRLYGWSKPSVTLGAFQKIENIDIGYCLNNDIPVIRRLTGGRGILHNDELTYSFSCQNQGSFKGGLFQSFRALSEAFKKAFILTGICPEIRTDKHSNAISRNPLCFASQSYGELSFRGKKIIGSAQKRWKDSFLQQGSIPYSIDNNSLKKIFRIDLKDSQDDIKGIRYLIPKFSPVILRENIRKSFEETFKIIFADSRPSSQEIEMAQRLAVEKYRCLR